MATAIREVPMDLTALPIQQCQRSNIYALVYGEGGTGKGQFALRMAHRLTAPHGGLIIAIEADGDRMRRHARRPDGTGFTWRTIKFPNADPIRLAKVVGELADAAAKATVPVTVIFDGMTRFWNDVGGFKDRAEDYGGLNSKGQVKLKGWGPVKAEERVLYLNLRRLRDHAHVICCLEQANEFKNQELIGVKPDVRKGLVHEADFIFRMERYLGQDDTAHEANIQRGAADVHRAIVEKTALVKLRTKEDGSVNFHYPMPTGTVFIDPGEAIADLMVAELDGLADTLEAETEAYLKQLSGASAATLRDAWLWVRDVAWWPEEVKEEVKDAIQALGVAAGGATTTETSQQSTQATWPWEGLGMNSRIEEWSEAGEQILEGAERDEVEAFRRHAEACERLDLVAPYLKARTEELDAVDHIPTTEQ